MIYVSGVNIYGQKNGVEIYIYFFLQKKVAKICHIRSCCIEKEDVEWKLTQSI